MKRLIILSTICCSFLFFVEAHAQSAREFEVTKVTAEFIKTPDYSISIGPQKRGKSEQWLEIEVEFAWAPPKTAAAVPFLDDLTVNYYVLLNNKDQQNPKGTLLIGQVTHTSISAGKDLRSVMYISPRGLTRLFNGKVPPTTKLAIQDIGITLSKQGQIVAAKNLSYKGNEQWWTTLQQTQGLLLNKSETPFAPLFWDYYEVIKPKS